MAEQNNTNFISKIKIPAAISGAETDIVYDILDASAIHDLTDLGLSNVLTFKGVVAEMGDLPNANNKIGDVYHVENEDYEYVWIDSDNDDIGDTWEEFGAAHDFIGTDDFEEHTHQFTPGSVTIPDLTVTGAVPAYKADKTYLSAEAEAPTLTGSDPASVLKGDAVTSISAVKTVSVTSSADAQQETGTAAEWLATVSDGVLSFSWTPNTPSTVVGTVVTSVTAETEDIEVSFAADQAIDIDTTWEAGAPAVTISDGETGDVEVATEISTNGTNTISDGVAAGATVTITGGTVGSVILPTSTT